MDLAGRRCGRFNLSATRVITNPDSGKREAKQRIPEENLGNRKQNNGFQNKTWETGSDTKDFRSKSGKQEAKQRISEQNLGSRSTKPGRKTMDLLNCIELADLGGLEWT